MSTTNKVLLGILGVVVLLGLWFMSSYNGFVGREESVKTAWSQVETQYQRRFDLIPNLAESVKGVLKQEQDVFGTIAKARSSYAAAPSGSNEKVAAANQLEGGLSRLLVIMENYPQLKSSETVQSLMTQLEGTENRVSVARERYNESVEDYNVSVRRFPGKMIASIFGFSEKTRFEAVKEAANAPKVDLSLTK